MSRMPSDSARARAPPCASSKDPRERKRALKFGAAGNYFPPLRGTRRFRGSWSGATPSGELFLFHQGSWGAPTLSRAPWPRPSKIWNGLITLWNDACGGFRLGPSTLADASNAPHPCACAFSPGRRWPNGSRQEHEAKTVPPDETRRHPSTQRGFNLRPIGHRPSASDRNFPGPHICRLSSRKLGCFMDSSML